MRRLLLFAAVLLPAIGAAQSGAEAEPRVIVVPYPSDGQLAPDAGLSQPPPTPEVAPPMPAPADMPQQNQPPPPQPPRPFEAQNVPDDQLQPPAPPPSNLLPQDVDANRPPGAMLDGHPREGAFLSGPGSMTFVLHHTLMGMLGAMATQVIPRLLDPTMGVASNEGARLAYLASGLIGLGVGFGTSAAWQFFHWMDQPAAAFGIADGIFGAMFGAGFANLFSTDPSAVAWTSLFTALAGAWLTTIVGGGELATNKGLLIVSGAFWAAAFTAMGVAIAATTGGGQNPRIGGDVILIAPAIGAGLMALALLKFNPSTAQVLRADIFGTAAGAAVLLISALVLGANFNHPVPYILAGVAAAGAIATVSLLWAEAAETNSEPGSKVSSWFDPEASKGYRRSWW